jgi:hypothetical protein
MERIVELSVRLTDEELRDAGEDVERLLDGDGDFCPAFRVILNSLDEAIAAAASEAAQR